MSRASTQASASSTVDVASPVGLAPVATPSSKSQSSTSQGAASSQASQASPSASSSDTPSTAAAGPSPSPSSANSPVASFSVLSPTSSTSSSSSGTPAPINLDSSGVTLTSTSTGSFQSPTPSESQSQITPQSQASTGGATFFHNKPAMIAVFASAGIFALVVVFILMTILVRRKRRRDLLNSAIDFSPTMDHLISMDDDSRGGGGSINALLSRSSGSLSSETRGTRPRVPSIVFGAGPNAPLPALTPAPLSVPASVAAPREMQQRGPGTGFIGGDRRLDRGDTLGARYPYGNSAQPYYDTVRQQTPLQSQSQQQQQQQLQYQPQLQQSRSLRWQRQEERRPPSDLPTDVNPVPAALMPSYQRDPVAYNAPFGTTGTKPSQLNNVDGGTAGGAWISRTTSKRERRRTQQVPLPPPASFPRKNPDTLGRNDEGTEDTNASVDEDLRNRPRILKVMNG